MKMELSLTQRELVDAILKNDGDLTADVRLVQRNDGKIREEVIISGVWSKHGVLCNECLCGEKHYVDGKYLSVRALWKKGKFQTGSINRRNAKTLYEVMAGVDRLSEEARGWSQ